MHQAHTNVMRGKRLREVREALGLTQPAFADRLNAVAASLGLSGGYDAVEVSKRETGRRALDIEDYTTVSFLAPGRWPVLWLAFGEELGIKARVPLPRPKASGAGR